MRTQSFILSLVAVFLLGVLVACGGNQGPAASVSSVSTDIAARGESVSINGAGLSGVTVYIGNVQVAPASRTDTKLTFTVPNSARSGPQTLTLQAGDGLIERSLFVGIDYPSGTLEQLAALNLPPDTAVRLAATTYTSSGFVRLDNLSLYGVDPTKTLLDLELLSVDPDAALALKVDPGSELVLANLSLHLGALTVTGLGLETFSTPPALGIMEVLDTLEIEATAAPSTGSFTFDNVVISDGGSGEESYVAFYGPDLIPVHVHILNSEFTGSDLMAMMMTPGLTVTNSVIKANYALLAGLFEPVVIQNSRVEANFDESSMIGLSGSRGVYVDETEFVSTGGIEITNPFGGALPAASVVTVLDSSFVVLAPSGGLDPDPVFEANFMVQDALFDNVTFTIAGPMVFAAGVASQVTVTNSNITVGDAAFPDDAVFLGFQLLEGFEKGVTLTDSNVAFASAGDIWIYADDIENGAALLDFSGNTIAGLEGKSDTAMSLGIGKVESEYLISINDNVFTGFEHAFYISLDASSTGLVTGEIHNNVFDFDITTVGAVATLEDVTFSVAYFDASHNIWGIHTDTGDVQSYIETVGVGDSSTFNVAPITPAP